ncbi:MAG: hypothetical protein IIZ39_07845 [Blautia sp.]|nr:hypothetical protein [Blautia sp.]
MGEPEPLESGHINEAGIGQGHHALSSRADMDGHGSDRQCCRTATMSTGQPADVHPL